MRQNTTRPPAHTHAPHAAALAPTAAPDGALAPSPPTTRRLAAHSLSANTRAAYTRAVRQFDAWRGAAPATDATLALRAADAAPTDRVVGLSPLQIQRRFTAAARAAGIEARVTAHSGRVGLASELTARGASTTEVMLAGNWKTARMVAHYSAGATAERGAVQKYL